MPRLLKIDAAADHLGLSRDQLRGLVYRRQIPFVKIGEGRGQLFFDVQQLDRWISEHTIEAAS